MCLSSRLLTYYSCADQQNQDPHFDLYKVDHVSTVCKVSLVVCLLLLNVLYQPILCNYVQHTTAMLPPGGRFSPADMRGQSVLVNQNRTPAPANLFVCFLPDPPA